MKVKSESEVDQSCLTPSDPMDCSPPGSFVPGIFQLRVLEWGAIVFFRLLKLVSCYLKTEMLITKITNIIAYFREGNGNPLQYSCLENPVVGEPGRLQSMGSLRVGHD